MIFYTYTLANSKDKKVFYVGKGKAKRMYAHEKDAKNGKSFNKHLTRKILKLKRDGFFIIYNKVFETINEDLALDKEIELIKFYGIKNLCNQTLGGKGKKEYFLPYEEAKEIVNNLNLKSNKEWSNYCKSNKKRKDIPSQPNEVYLDNGWLSWGDWLGNNNISNWNKIFLPFNEAKEFVHTLNLYSYNEWRKYCKNNKLSKTLNNIPISPQDTYKDKGWISWGDFLGTKRIADRLKNYLSFEDARKYVQKLNIKTYDEWKEYSKTEKRPKNIPSSPWEVYKNKGWISMPDWLNNSRFQLRKRRDFLSFEVAKKYVHSLNLKSYNEWKLYCNSEKRPLNIPSNPHQVYEKNGWLGMGDWLGTGRIADFNIVFLSFNEAKCFIHTLKLKGQKDWEKYCKSGNKPSNIPTNPQRTYKNKGWINWSDFLGK